MNRPKIVRIVFLDSGVHSFFCNGGTTGPPHEDVPVVLFEKPSKVVWRGVCPECQRVYVSISKEKKNV